MKWWFNLFVFPFFVLQFWSCQNTGEKADLIIKNGTVVDGTGSDSFISDIVVIGDSIAYIGTSHSFHSDSVIDASGYVVSPGFIDPHSHGNPFRTPSFDNFLFQGVTTICLGQDGGGPYTGNLSDWFDGLDTLGLGVNVSSLMGHGTIRRMAGVKDTESPSAEQLKQMSEFLTNSMEEGALGLSTGLEYIPGYFAEENELITLAQVVGNKGGIIMSHTRNEDEDKVNESIRELLRQGQYSKVQVSHMKVVYGKGEDRALNVIQMLDSARNAGIEVYADIYPFTASYTGIGIVFPDWAKTADDFSLIVKSRREELREYLIQRVESRNGPEATLLGTAPWAGLTLLEVADSLNKHYADVLIDDIGPRGASAAYFVMDEELQAALLDYEFSMVCTDGSPTMHHPRGYGSFSKIIEEFVIGTGRLSLEKAVYKMSGLPAQSMGLMNRGTLKEGNKADILIFKPESIKTQATFEEPHLLSSGFNTVIVNGRVIIKDGSRLDINAGQPVKSNLN